MLAALIATAAVLLLVTTAAVVLGLRLKTAAEKSEAVPEPDWFAAAIRKRVIVHQLNDRSIEGSLWERTADGILLRSAKYLGESGQADIPMAGEVFIPRENVAFVQMDE
jgi:hypothetical protein